MLWPVFPEWQILASHVLSFFNSLITLHSSFPKASESFTVLTKFFTLYYACGLLSVLQTFSAATSAGTLPLLSGGGYPYLQNETHKF